MTTQTDGKTNTVHRRLRSAGGTLRLILSNPMSAFGLIVVILFFGSAIVVTIFGNAVLPFPPNKLNLNGVLLSPSLTHLMGTDNYGRDIFSRILAATPEDASISLLVVVVSVVIGLFLGALAGMSGGKIDELIMRITDVFMAFPGLILALAVGAALGPGAVHMAEALVIVWWPPYIRIARGETLSLKQNWYISAARLSGHKTMTIVRKHVIPNIISPILIYATLDLGSVIIVASILSYLGLGAQPPQAEWGRMVLDGQDYLFTKWWIPIFPSLAILFTVLGFNALGDNLRDLFDPKQRSSLKTRLTGA